MFISLICLVIAGGFILDGLLKLEAGERRVNLLALIGLDAAVLVFAVGGSILAGKPVTELVLSAVGILLVYDPDPSIYQNENDTCAFSTWRCWLSCSSICSASIGISCKDDHRRKSCHRAERLQRT